MKNSLFVNTLKDVLDGKGQSLTPNSVQAGSLRPKIDNFYNNGHQLGTTTYLRALDDHLRWRNGFLYTVSGFPGAGKSTFVNYLAVLKSQNEKTKVAIYSPESYPIEDLIEELLIQLVGKNVASTFGNQMTPDELDAAMRYINDHFYFLAFSDIPSQADVFAEFQRLKDVEGVSLFIIDPFNSLVEGSNMGGGGNMSIFLKGALTRTKLFATQNQVPLVIVEHPRSAGITNAADMPEPSPFLINGGAMFWNKSDVIFTVHRNMFDSRDPNVSIKIWKVKKQRLMGKPGEVMVTFDSKTSQYS